MEDDKKQDDTAGTLSDQRMVRLFCHPNREDIREPFSDDTFTYFTDGRIILRQSKMPEMTKPNPFASLKELPWDEVFTEWIPLKCVEIKHKECQRCNGGGKVSKCPECEGEGYVTLDTRYHSYESRCKTCEGEEVFPGDDQKCDACYGSGLIPIDDKYKIGNVIINAKYIHVLGHLKNVELVVIGDPLKPVPFRCDEGIGFVMPMRA